MTFFLQNLKKQKNKTEINLQTEKRLVVTKGERMGWVGIIGEGNKDVYNLNYYINYTWG